jgi:hypothetical protein
MKRLWYGLSTLVLALGVFAIAPISTATAARPAPLTISLTAGGAAISSLKFGSCSVTNGCNTDDTLLYFNNNNSDPNSVPIFVGQTFFTGRNIGDFQSHPGFPDQDCQNNAYNPIPPGGYCTLGVAFQPFGDTTGHKSATFWAQYYTCNGNLCSFAISVRFTGTATA